MKLREKTELVDEEFTNFDKFYIALLFFYCFLGGVPIFYALFPGIGLLYKGIWCLTVGVLTFFTVRQTIRKGSVKINRELLFISFMFILLAILPTIYHKTTYLFLDEFIHFYYLYMFFIYYKEKYLVPLVNIATVFFFVMIVSSIIGFVYAFLGNPPVYSGVIRYSGQVIHWYLTTGAFNNVIWGNIIRPQGIYGEPGFLVFYTSTVCLLRIFTKKSDIVTFILLLLVNITFSMINIILFVMFILHLIVKYKLKKMFVCYVPVIAGITFLAYLPLRETIDDVLFARFVIDESTGIMRGNNRQHLFNNAMELVKKDNSILIWGLPRDSEGLTMMDKEWGYGENPLSNMVKFGIFIAWLYYFYLLFFMLCGLIDRKNFFVYFSIFLMLLNAPVFYRDAPTACLLLLFFTSYSSVKRHIISNKCISSKNNYIPNAIQGVKIWKNDGIC